MGRLHDKATDQHHLSQLTNASWLMTEMATKVISQIVSDLYDKPIMSNIVRPHYVERMIAVGLGEAWKLVSADWSGWDIENMEGIRIEVKQSAARQTWTDRPSLRGRPTKGSFDIAPRTGYFSDGGSKWVKYVGRPADIYIFAWHPVAEKNVCDHRDPDQWRFHVVIETDLPPAQKTISESVLIRKSGAAEFNKLLPAVSAAVAKLSGRKSDSTIS